MIHFCYAQALKHACLAGPESDGENFENKNIGRLFS